MSFARAFLSLLPAAATLTAAAQSPRDVLPVNVRFSATRAQTVSGTCCFYLTGGAADMAFHMLNGFSAAVEVNGNTTSHVTGTSRGLSTVTLLAGPRYTLPFRRVSVAGQALFGAARGFDADFTSGTRSADTATAFGMIGGGFVEVGLSRSLRLRLAQVDYSQTNLPNGTDNRQRNVRFGTGITFDVHLPQNRR